MKAAQEQVEAVDELPEEELSRRNGQGPGAGATRTSGADGSGAEGVGELGRRKEVCETKRTREPV